MRRGLFLAVSVVAGSAFAQPAAPDLPADAQAAYESIRATRLQATINFLAANALEGRESGERGANVAADYLISRFQAAGLEPGTREGFQQNFDLRWRILGPDVAFSLERAGGGATVRRDFATGRDWLPLSFSAVGAVEAPVVFAGYGISAPEQGWDDYAAIPGGATGKIVLVFRHEPDEEGEAAAARFDGREMTLHASLRQKVRAARAHGAVGLILVDDPLHHEVLENPASGWRSLTDDERALPDDDPVRFRGRPDTRDDAEPLGLIAAHASQEILGWLDPDLDWKEFQREMDSAWKPRPRTFTGITARIEHDWDASYRRAQNVIAVIRGSDPELSGEYVLVGGHFDHVGMDEEAGEIYNGADDNASGTSAVVALAEAFAAMPQKPKRSLIFAAWGAEEKGLLGSDWFVHHPPLDLGKIVAAVNLDMIGRNDETRISVVGRVETPDLVELCDRFASVAGLELNDDAGAGASRSDNASLWLAGIPTVGLFSGTHEDYHEPSDTPGKIVTGKVERATKLTFLVMHAVASGASTPEPLQVPAGPWKPVAPESRLFKRSGS